MKKSLRILFSFLFISGCVRTFYAQNLNDVLPKDPSVRTGTLANGLKYYIRQNHKPEKRAEFRLAVKTGSIMENDDQQGLAHFCEHMQFNGTEHFPKMDLVNFLESTGVRFGAHLNAYTSFDETVYMLQLPMDKPELLDKGILVLHDWAGHATFDDVEIDKERGVVIEEWRLGRGAGERVNNKHLPNELYKSHYAERLPIGKKEILEKCSHETLRNFYHDWYRPDLMAVIAVGDFDIDAIEKKIKENFSKLQNPPNERPRTKYDVPFHDKTIISIAGDKELSFQNAYVIYKHPEEKTKTVADYRRDMISSVYDAMLNERLQELTKSGNPPFTFARANYGEYLGGIDAFTLFAGLKPDALLGGLQAVLEEVTRVKQHGFTATELERQKTQMLVRMDQQYKEKDKTESSNYVQEYLRNYLHEEPYPGIEYENELYKKFLRGITLDEVNALSKKRMEGTSRVITLSYQQKDGVTAPTEDQVEDMLSKIEKSSLKAYEDKVSNEPLLAQKPKPGKIVSEKKIADLGVTEWTLSNGARIVLKPTDFKNDQILFSAFKPGGSSLASDADYLSAEAAATIVDMGGAGKFDVTVLDKMLSGKNISLSPTISSLQEGFNGSTTPKDQETMFQLLYLYCTQPRKDPQAFESYYQRRASQLKSSDAAPEAAFADTLQVTMSQYNYRARPMKLRMLDEITLDKAYQFYKDRFSNFNGFTFFIVGNVDMEQMRKLIETYIASLPSNNQKESWKDVGIAPPQGVITKSVHKGIEPKGSVTINITGPFEWNAKNRFDMQAMAEVISIKLRETLREDKGGVYGVRVSATPTHYPHQRFQLTVAFGCDPLRIQELVDEAMKKLDTMMMKAPEDTYVAKVKETQKRDYEVNMKENRFWLSALSQYYFNGEDPLALLQRKDMIEHLSAEDIHKAAQKYCARNNMVEVVLYPEKKD